MKQHLVVVGSINMDLVVRTPRMPLPGETLLGSGFHTIPGGKGANQAVAAARQGAAVKIVGGVGDDDFGQAQRRCLDAEGIDLSLLQVDAQQATGIAMIMIDHSGQNSIIVSAGANNAVSVAQIDSAKDAIAHAAMLICQLEVPVESVIHAIELAHRCQTPVLLNPAPAYHGLDLKLFEKVTYLILNESEAEALTGVTVSDVLSAKTATMHLRDAGAKTVILTLGANGAVVAYDGELYHEPALAVHAVDTTAAGDTFVGCFAVAISEGVSVPEAVRIATHASALSVTKLGAQPSIPTRQEVEQFIAQRRA